MLTRPLFQLQMQVLVLRLSEPSLNFMQWHIWPISRRTEDAVHGVGFDEVSAPFHSRCEHGTSGTGVRRDSISGLRSFLLSAVRPWLSSRTRRSSQSTRTVLSELVSHPSAGALMCVTICNIRGISNLRPRKPDWVSNSTHPAQYWSGESQNGTVFMLVRHFLCMSGDSC